MILTDFLTSQAGSLCHSCQTCVSSAKLGHDAYLAEDMSESKNLADAQPERVKAMRARLESMLKNAVPPGDSLRDSKLETKKQKKGKQ